MKRKLKVIQICGIRGILTAAFIFTCLGAGFIVFPGYVAMHIWNRFITGLHELNLYQGVLLWAIIYLTYFILTKKTVGVSFGLPKELSDEEMNVLMERVRMQARAREINKMIIKNLEEKEDLLKQEEPSEKETINK